MTEVEQVLVAQDVYLKAGIHIGTKFRTKYMEYVTHPNCDTSPHRPPSPSCSAR